MVFNNGEVLNDRDSHSVQQVNKSASTKAETPKPDKVERGNGKNDRPHKGNTYQEGTADDDNQPNIPGPNELPDQQKVGEEVDDDDREHIET